MPPVTIPFARKEAYRNPEYTRAMADLMIQKSQEDARLRLARGQSVSNAWGQFGNVVMSSLTDIQQKRALDEKVARDQEQQRIENEMKRQEMAERAADRRADEAWRQQQFRETRGAAFTEGKDIGAGISPEEQAQMVGGTAAAGRWAHQPAMDARLPATPMIERMGLPAGSTMSQDIAARPEQYVRRPNTQEALAQKGLERQDQALRLQIYNTNADNIRQSQRDAQLASQYAQTAAATEAYRNARLAQGGAPTTAKLAVAAAAGDVNAQAALDIIQRTEGRGDERSADKFFTMSGEFLKEPMVKAADRTVILDDSIKNVRANPTGSPGQLALAYSFVQVVDTYQSAVREGELRNIGILDSDIANWKKALSGVVNQKQLLSPSLALQIADTAEKMSMAIQQAKENKANDYRRRAATMHIEDMWDSYYGPQTTRVQPGQMPGGGGGGGGTFFDRQPTPVQPAPPYDPNIPLGGRPPAPPAPPAPPPFKLPMGGG